MEKNNIAHTADMSDNFDETSAMAINEKSERLESQTSEKRARKPRRSAKEIQAEYEDFKALFEEGRPILEISRTLEITKSQTDSYLTKISLEQHKRTLIYEVCEGHRLPDSILEMLEGNRFDLFKYKLSIDEDGRSVVVKLHKPTDSEV